MGADANPNRRAGDLAIRNQDGGWDVREHEPDDAVGVYLSEVRAARLLTAEEERRLARQLERGEYLSSLRLAGGDGEASGADVCLNVLRCIEAARPEAEETYVASHPGEQLPPTLTQLLDLAIRRLWTTCCLCARWR